MSSISALADTRNPASWNMHQALFVIAFPTLDFKGMGIVNCQLCLGCAVAGPNPKPIKPSERKIVHVTCTVLYSHGGTNEFLGSLGPRTLSKWQFMLAGLLQQLKVTQKI